MTELSAHVPETLWEDGEFVLSRAVPDGEPLSILAATPLTNPPSPAAIARLRATRFQAAERTRPCLGGSAAEARDRQGSACAVERGSRRRAPVAASGTALGDRFVFASFAIGLAAALARLHGRGLIHKDINPANILVNNATWEVWLTGFGIASHLPRERQAPGSTEAIAGTLAYMAPEQTGRMNRSIDSRSDLYACGVTFYENDHRNAPVLGIRSAGMDPLPHRPPAGAAKPAGPRNSRPRSTPSSRSCSQSRQRIVSRPPRASKRICAHA